MGAFWRRPRARVLIDDGIALVSVVGAMTIVTLFLLTGLALVLTNAPKSRQDQDSKTAIAAAEAGVEDYIARLNANDSYWTNGNVDAGNAAFTSAGRVIPGTSGATGVYSYKVLNSSTVASSGQILLQVTGKSTPGAGHASVSRTITVALSPEGFLRFIYFSDVEVLDPTIMSGPMLVKRNGSNGPGGALRYAVYPEQACGLYYYTGRSGSYTASAANPVRVWNTSTSSYTATTYSSGTVTNFSCLEIQWATGDVVNGPMHSNDALQVGGSVRFANAVTESSWPYCQTFHDPPLSSEKCWWGSGTPSGSGYRPYYGAPMSVPVGNQELLQYVEPRVDDPSADPGPGCYYSGNTEITFQGTTMQVLSPATSDPDTPSRCLDVATRSSWQTKDIPPVIYVDSTTNTGTYTLFDYPKTGEDTNGSTYSDGSLKDATTDYTRTRGTAYVQGSVDTQVTVAAKDDVVVTGDLTDPDNGAGTNIVGLVAGNYVWVYHPVNGSNVNMLSSADRPNDIDAAVLSLRHSFIVQNWARGASLGNLNVTGSISQKYRGPVGTSASTGYLKNYVYDTRLLVMQPPYFIKPDSSPWRVLTTIDK